MSAKKTSGTIAILFLLLTGTAFADPRAILREYSALTNDLGVLNGLVTAYQGLEFFDLPKYEYQAGVVDNSKAWVAWQAYKNVSHAVRGVLKKTSAHVDNFRNPDLKEQILLIIDSFARLVPESSKTADEKVWLAEREGVLKTLNEATAQLAKMRDSLKGKLEARTSEIASFLEASRLQDPQFFSRAEQDEFERLQQAIREAQRTQAAQKEQLKALNEEFALEQQKLANCKSAQASLTDNCRSLQAEVETRKREILGVMDLAMREFRERLKSGALKSDEKVIQGVERLPIDLRANFQATVGMVFEKQIIALCPAQRSEDSYVKFVVDVLTFSSLKKSVDLSVSISVRGMECPVKHFIEGLKLNNSGKLSELLEMELPKLFRFAAQNRESEDRMVREAEGRGRAHCDERSRAPASYPNVYPSAPAQAWDLAQHFGSFGK
jgi:hypothetical protein